MWQAVFGDVVVAQARRTTVAGGRRFFAPETVRWDLLRPTPRTGSHQGLGVAHYFDVVVGERVASDAAWCYPEPRADALNIKSYVAFRGDVATEPVPDAPRRSTFRRVFARHAR